MPCLKVFLRHGMYCFTGSPIFEPAFFVQDCVVIIQMSNSINELALAAKIDGLQREALIRSHENLILKTASRASFRYVTKSDDEWSIALCAFSDAIDSYRPDQGGFLPFSQMLIKRALIDYHRSTARHLTEISTSPFVLEGVDEDPDDWEKSVFLAVAEQSRESADRSLPDEIAAANEALQRYGFRFFDLTDCSPQQEKTKQACAAAIRFVLSRPRLLEEMEKTRKLPIRAVADGSGVSKKILDRYRKYIIMAVLILNGEYPQLSEYLKYVRKEGTA